MVDSTDVIRRHVLEFFADRACKEHVWTLGPAADELPELRVAEFAPKSENEVGYT
jgi:hypothetical protein